MAPMPRKRKPSTLLPPEFWRLRCGCVLYTAPSTLAPRQMHLARCNERFQGQNASSALTALPWPAHFMEGDETPHRGSRSDAPYPPPGGKAEPAPVAWYDRKGFVVTLTSQNLWHTLFGAVPTFALYKQQFVAEDADLIPRYVKVGEPGANQWGVGYGGWGVRSRSAAATIDEPVAGWATWQMLFLALRPLARWEEAARRTQTIFRPAQYHCFARGLSGGHGAWFPRGDNLTSLVSARPALAAFRGAVLANLGPPLRHRASSLPRTVFLLRRAYRVVVNEGDVVAELQRELQRETELVWTRMEELPLTEQLHLVAGARLLAGVHGGGLAWSAFLPERAALLEVYPDVMLRKRVHALYDYYRIAVMRGIAHFTLVQPTTPACAAQVFTFCGNVSVNATELSHVVRRSLAWAAATRQERERLLARRAATLKARPSAERRRPRAPPAWHPDRPTVCDYHHALPFPSCRRRLQCCVGAS